MLRRKMNLLCLAAAVFGIGVMCIAAEAVEAKQVSIGEIGEGNLETRVFVRAMVASRRESKGNLFLELYDGTGRIRAVAFGLGKEGKRVLAENDFAEFQGKVKMYEGSLELVVEEIREWQ